MSIDELINKLTEYKGKTVQLRIAQNKLKRLNSRLDEVNDNKYNAKITPSYTEASNSNTVNSKVENQIIKYEEDILRINADIEATKIEISQLECDIEDIDARLDGLNRLEKAIVVAYYIDGETIEDIGNIIYYKVTKEIKGIGETRGTKTIKTKLNQILQKMASY